MALFVARTKKVVPGLRHGAVPAGFEALADGLDGAGSIEAVAQEIGRRGAYEGYSIADLLLDLARTYQVCDPDFIEPPFEVVRVFTSAWADASLRYLHGVSCEDPLTGLASLAHVRSRLSEIYRAAERDGHDGCPDFALLVVELHWRETSPSHFDRVLRMLDIAEFMRKVYAGEEIIGQLTPSRVVAVVRRDDRLGDSVAGLLGLLGEWQSECGVGTRLWIEGLPAAADSGDALLDELAR